MLPALATLNHMLTLNTRLFVNCLAGTAGELWTRRPAEGTNHLAFTACHILGARYYILKLMGEQGDDPVAARLATLGKIDEVEDWPTPEELVEPMRRYGERLGELFASTTAESLAVDSGQPFPMKDTSLLSSVTFLIQHEAYHIGQLALLRRQFGLEAMKYS